MLPLLCSWPLAATFFGSSGGVNQKVEAAATRFAELTQSPATTSVAFVYARQAESAIQAEGVSSTRKKNTDSERKPWQLVGRVACAEAGALQRAIHAQRALLVESARSQHKELKFLQMLSLAYTVEAILPGELPRVGSFRCSNCGTHNDAAAERCSNCGEPRGPDDPDAGGLTLAVAPKRERPLPLESCGFAPDGT